MCACLDAKKLKVLKQGLLKNRFFARKKPKTKLPPYGKHLRYRYDGLAHQSKSIKDDRTMGSFLRRDKKKTAHFCVLFSFW